MTPPILLTAPTAALPDPPDCPKRNVALPSFGVLLTSPPRTGPPFSSSTVAPTSTGDSASKDSDLYDPDASFRSNRALAHSVRQWTGAPIRAIVPLPRRKFGVAVPNADAGALRGGIDVPASNLASVGALPCLARAAAHCWDDADTDPDSAGEIEEEDGDGEGDRNASSGSRHCSYESITAAEGLSAWSFEELRVECYAQSLVARGTKPLPVVQPALAIPPAFVPRIVLRS